LKNSYVPKIERAADNPKHKGILTIDEVRRLFSIPWKSDAAYCHPVKDEFKGYVGNLLASSTGLRMGEIQALVLSDIHLEDGYIYVRRSWDRKYGLWYEVCQRQYSLKGISFEKEIYDINETVKKIQKGQVFLVSHLKDELRDIFEQALQNMSPDNSSFIASGVTATSTGMAYFPRCISCGKVA
jgi:integrase